ncbi:hypothetical protein [Actinokineospora cianjurensis]|uniref:hypothetical protein n=1 Tax=Actinokineospora cianjurensis TaxID=585224 RepID=UPI0011C39121|nr:hypothetical protein [Actinokineospora cianjurensis]
MIKETINDHTRICQRNHGDTADTDKFTGHGVIRRVSADQGRWTLRRVLVGGCQDDRSQNWSNFTRRSTIHRSGSCLPRGSTKDSMGEPIASSVDAYDVHDTSR